MRRAGVRFQVEVERRNYDLLLLSEDDLDSQRFECAGVCGVSHGVAA